MSRKAQRKYWFHTLNKRSVFECPPEALVTFRCGFEQRLLWLWEEGVKLHEAQPCEANPEKLQGMELFGHISKMTG